VRGPHAADAPLIVADLDALDLSNVRLPHDTAYYQPIDGRSDKLRADSVATFAHPAKKELVYYDGQVDVAFDSGQSQIAPDANAFAFVYLQVHGPSKAPRPSPLRRGHDGPVGRLGRVCHRPSA